MGNEREERCNLCKQGCSHVQLLLLGAVMTQNSAMHLGIPSMGWEWALLNKARLQASQHTTVLAIK